MCCEERSAGERSMSHRLLLREEVVSMVPDPNDRPEETYADDEEYWRKSLASVADKLAQIDRACHAAQTHVFHLRASAKWKD